jgi:uncharacterized phage protein (TIGR01671 family)
MTREIKFRAWDGELMTGSLTLQEIVTDDTDFRQFWFDFKAVMQFTGLHDKNGREIYEGDIVSWRRDDETYTHSIRWSEAFACFDFPMTVVQQMPQFYELEVVGNIYENPELLEGKA